jgi:O-antigen/teichoic acid export membrane protein
VIRNQAILLSNFAWNLTGGVSVAAASFLLQVIIARAGGPSLLGNYSIAMAYVAPIYMFSALQLRQILATDVINQFPFQVYFCLRIATTFLASLIILVGIASDPALPTQLIFAIACFKSAEWIGDIFLGLFQKVQRIDLIGKSLLIKSAVLLLSCTAVLLTYNQIALGFLITTIFTAATVYFFDFRLGFQKIDKDQQVFTAPIEISALWQLLHTTLPLGFVMFLIALHANIPKYFIQAQLGIEALGLFSGLFMVANVPSLVVQSTVQPLAAKFALCAANRDKNQFLKLLAMTSIVGLAMSVISIFIMTMFGEKLYTVLLGPRFFKPNVLKIIMLALSIQFITPYGVALTALRCTKPQVFLQALITATTTTGCYFLIQRYGLAGAAYSVLIGNLVRAAGLSFLLVFAMQKTFIDHIDHQKRRIV